MATTVVVNKRGGERCRARHLWIYRSDVTDTSGAQPGEIVRVSDNRKTALGWALYSSSSQIALRFISYEEREIDREFWLSRLIAAEQLRQRVVANASAYRLVYGESDLLPALIIDRYNDCFSIQTLSQGMDALKQMWIELLVERYHPARSSSATKLGSGNWRDSHKLPDWSTAKTPARWSSKNAASVSR